MYMALYRKFKLETKVHIYFKFAYVPKLLMMNVTEDSSLPCNSTAMRTRLSMCERQIAPGVREKGYC